MRYILKTVSFCCFFLSGCGGIRHLEKLPEVPDSNPWKRITAMVNENIQTMAKDSFAPIMYQDYQVLSIDSLQRLANVFLKKYDVSKLKFSVSINYCGGLKIYRWKPVEPVFYPVKEIMLAGYEDTAYNDIPDQTRVMEIQVKCSDKNILFMQTLGGKITGLTIDYLPVELEDYPSSKPVLYKAEILNRYKSIARTCF